MPFICAAEEKLKQASKDLSITEKTAQIKLTLDFISGHASEMQPTDPVEDAKLFRRIDRHYCILKDQAARCATALKKHITDKKDKLASAQALQDSLQPQQKDLMKQVIDALTEEVDKAEKLEGSFKEK